MISPDTVHGQEQEPEQIEGLDWDQEKLYKEIVCCLDSLCSGSADCSDDEDDWSVKEEDSARHERVKEVNERLALYRIRAYKEDYRDVDISILKSIYPPAVLEKEGYYEHYECDFGWYFDTQYAGLKRQDYQLLVLRNDDGDFYESWECYLRANSTLEGDQQFMQFWEKLSKTKLVELFLRDKTNELQNLLYYHALKMAAEFPLVPKALFHKCVREFIWSVEFYDTWYKLYAEFFFDMRELIYKQEMEFKDALSHLYKEGKYKKSLLPWEPRPYIFERHAQDDDSYQFIMDCIEKTLMRPKTYYDYAKKKLDIAKEIGLIPLNPNTSSM